MYKHIIRPILFKFNPELAHAMTFACFKFLRYIPGSTPFLKQLYRAKDPSLSRELFGLKFDNPVGIAGGLDKNGEFYNDLYNFGPSFVEIGSLTPNPQNGNDQPRLFRLPEDQAIINRMGINNKGVKYAIEQLKSNKPMGVKVVANLSKNATTPNDQAYKDFGTSFSLLYDFVDMFTLNISCPNVKNLTELQDIDMLSKIIGHLMDIRRYNDEYRPILLKISPDIPFEQVDQILDLALLEGIDGIIATNTTRSREGLVTNKEKVNEIGNGGLSGAPLFERSLAMVKYLHKKSNGIIPIIGCGGIMTPEQALKMLDAGASMIEVYTGFIYNGPAFIKKILKSIAERENSSKTVVSE